MVAHLEVVRLLVPPPLAARLVAIGTLDSSVGSMDYRSVDVTFNQGVLDQMTDEVNRAKREESGFERLVFCCGFRAFAHVLGFQALVSDWDRLREHRVIEVRVTGDPVTFHGVACTWLFFMSDQQAVVATRGEGFAEEVRRRSRIRSE